MKRVMFKCLKCNKEIEGKVRASLVNLSYNTEFVISSNEENDENFLEETNKKILCGYVDRITFTCSECGDLVVTNSQCPNISGMISDKKTLSINETFFGLFNASDLENGCERKLGNKVMIKINSKDTIKKFKEWHEKNNAL